MFSKITFELKQEEDGFNIEDQAKTILEADNNRSKLEDIATFLREYDKYQEVLVGGYDVLATIRKKVFEIIGND